MWRATALTLFPEMFPGPLGESLAGKALTEGTWSLEAVDIRRFAKDRHGTVDDAPFGGGAGMVMKPDVLSDAIAAVSKAGVPKLLMSPRGAPFSQARARELAKGPGLSLLLFQLPDLLLPGNSRADHPQFQPWNNGSDGDIMSLYTTLPRNVVCEEVAKLRIAL